ncbi:MAG TPA: ABC transporter ATP-binding protein [Blastocatellia bacterium]|nr:ABC transporter ATP-binding protein [Blastocatellia bacterium]
MIDLTLRHVSKRYRIQPDSDEGKANPAWWRRLLPLRRLQDFYAVRDVSFEVRRGEALGIIGHNGAGKSTILRMLSGITTPTDGEIIINGQLSALIEVGSGFHPELTGRENIYLNGAILGMRRRDITARLDSIIDFAGVRKFIDVPVKRYSSGMYVRLGFSIAAHLDPDILLLDEVLAVGDAAFQAKCLQRIGELERAGKTIIFISHDLRAVEQLCDRVLLLQQGRVVAEGRPREVIAEYHRRSECRTPEPDSDIIEAELTREIEIRNFALQNDEGRTTTFLSGDQLKGRLAYTVHRPMNDVLFIGLIYTMWGELVCHLSSEWSCGLADLSGGSGEVELFCPELSLPPGNYQMAVEIWGCNRLLDRQSGFRLYVGPGRPVYGWFLMPHEWRWSDDEQLYSTRREQISDELLARS